MSLMDIRWFRLSISSWIDFGSLYLLSKWSILYNKSNFISKELFAAFSYDVFGVSVAIFS